MLRIALWREGIFAAIELGPVILGPGAEGWKGKVRKSKEGRWGDEVPSGSPKGLQNLKKAGNKRIA